MLQIPSGPTEVTAGWLSAATGWTLESVDLTQIGTDIGVSSSIYRATLEGDGCPASVVVKLAATAPAAVGTAVALDMYRREVKFFELFAPFAPVRVPTAYYGAVSDDGAQVVLVLEDLGQCRTSDQVIGMPVEDAARCVDAIAAWHAHWWRNVEGAVEQRAAWSLGNDTYPTLLPMLFAQGWSKVLHAPACEIPANLMDIGAGFGDILPPLLQQLDQQPVTLLHGDYRADNILFDVDGSPVTVDFQLIHTGSAAFDLAYFVTQSINVDIAGRHEADLIARWRAVVTAKGVDPADLSRIAEDYRAAVVVCLVYPVIGALNMDLDHPRQAALVNMMLSRMARAVADQQASAAQ